MSSMPLDELPQACAVPFRQRAGQLEFCLITSLTRRRWGFPKGVVEAHQTLVTAALAEAFEEAGLSGEIVSEALGDYADLKWNRPLRVTGFVMHVAAEHAHWPEDAVRSRRWCTAEEAHELIARDEQREFLARALAWIER